MGASTDADHAFGSLVSAEFPEVLGAGYLNAASLGPMPRRALRAVAAHLELRGGVQRMRARDFLDPPRLARHAIARLIGAEPGEIALTGNTSFGINLAAASLPVEDGSTVLLSAREFPANVLPWIASSRLRVEVVPRDSQGRPNEAGILERVSRGGIGIVAVSSAQYLDGFVIDLPRLGAACRAAGSYLVVDAIQSLGWSPLDVRSVPIDILACGGHKWLCGPFGAGFVYVRRELVPKLRPPVVGWTNVAGSENIEKLDDLELTWFDDARRFEYGTGALHDQLGLARAIEVLLEAGVERIRRHNERLLDPLRGWLANRDEWVRSDPSRGGSILAFAPAGLGSVAEELKRAGITCSVRGGVIRLAAHLYNTPEDIDRVIEVLDRYTRSGGA
jgi:cysteine desulfurase / selenocysteine lyase